MNRRETIPRERLVLDLGSVFGYIFIITGVFSSNIYLSIVGITFVVVIIFFKSITREKLRNDEEVKG